jgi:AraC-like DNA-binding protein
MTPAAQALPIQIRPPRDGDGGERNKVHAASRFPQDCLAGGLLETRVADLVRRGVTKFLVGLRPPSRSTGGFRGLSRVARAVHHALARMAERFAELYPTVASIAHEAGYSERHTARALAELRGLGLLEWDRRCIRTGKPAPKGGELVQQISNLYRLLIPPKLQAIMQGLDRGRPAPAGDAAAAWHARQRQADRLARLGEEQPAPAPIPRAAADRVVVRAVSADFNARMDARGAGVPPPVPRPPCRP